MKLFKFILSVFLVSQGLYLGYCFSAEEGQKKEIKEVVQEVLKEFRLTERVPVPEEKELLTLYDDGFYLKGKDDTLKIGGWYQGDLNVFNKGNEGNTRFRNRRVRLDLRGVLENVFEYRLHPQFAGTANLQEAWVEYKYFPNARIRGGQFKVPFSLESQYSSLWVDFVEPSLAVSNLQPAEDIGIMMFGNPWGVIEYGAAVVNGRLRTNEDNNDALDAAVRLVFSPFKKREEGVFKDLYFGGSFTWGNSDETLAGTGFSGASGNNFATYVDNTRHANDRFRYGAEFQWIYGPGDIKAEYIGTHLTNIERRTAMTDVNINSWYVSATYVLTGEQKPKNKFIIPNKIFAPGNHGWGAWEVGGRYEQFFVESNLFQTRFLTGTYRVDAVSFALNWWPNKHLRGMFNVVYTHFADDVLIGSDLEKYEGLILARAQYNF